MVGESASVSLFFFFFSDHFVANDPKKNSGKKGIQPMTMKPKCRTMISLSFARSSPEFF